MLPTFFMGKKLYKTFELGVFALQMYQSVACKVPVLQTKWKCVIQDEFLTQHVVGGKYHNAFFKLVPLKVVDVFFLWSELAEW